jgi:chromosome segregation ATPase
VDQVEKVLNHRDSLFYEKEKCLRLLGIDSDDQRSIQLDEVVSRLTGMSVNADMNVESKDSIIGRLRRQVEMLDQEAEAQSRQLDQYREEIANKEREIAQLRRNVHIS